MARYSKLTPDHTGLCDACQDRRARVFVDLSTMAMWVYLCGPCVRSLAARYADAAKLLKRISTRGAK